MPARFQKDIDLVFGIGCAEVRVVQVPEEPAVFLAMRCFQVELLVFAMLIPGHKDPGVCLGDRQNGAGFPAAVPRGGNQAYGGAVLRILGLSRENRR